MTVTQKMALAAIAVALLAAATATDAAKMFGMPRKAGDVIAMDTATTSTAATKKRFNEVKMMPGHDRREMVSSPRPHEYTDHASLPDNFSWANVEGKTFVTKSLNQHLPQVRRWSLVASTCSFLCLFLAFSSSVASSAMLLHQDVHYLRSVICVDVLTTTRRAVLSRSLLLVHDSK